MGTVGFRVEGFLPVVEVTTPLRRDYIGMYTERTSRQETTTCFRVQGEKQAFIPLLTMNIARTNGVTKLAGVLGLGVGFCRKYSGKVMREFRFFVAPYSDSNCRLNPKP